ncbi:helix-turn-helix transcriptional regulator [Weissella paramesenteroides]|uniref:helix-turn-helix domain-containing protein n=1 Tax=Weissella paramesenteroides TaxID=1249 RepID=UPI003F23969A
MTTFERIKEISKNKGYSLSKLNDLAGLGTNSIYHWRDKTPSTDSLKKVADVLGVSVDYLLGNTDDMHANKSTPTDADLEDALDGAVAYGGKPMSDNDRKILKGLLRAYFDNKEE